MSPLLPQFPSAFMNSAYPPCRGQASVPRFLPPSQPPVPPHPPPHLTPRRDHDSGATSWQSFQRLWGKPGTSCLFEALMLGRLVITSQVSAGSPSILLLSQRARAVARFSSAGCPRRSQHITCFQRPQRLESDHFTLLRKADVLAYLKLCPDLTLSYKVSEKEI